MKWNVEIKYKDFIYKIITSINIELEYSVVLIVYQYLIKKHTNFKKKHSHIVKTTKIY